MKGESVGAGLGRGFVSIGEVLPAVLARARWVGDDDGTFPCLATGYSDLDWMLGGLQPGSITVVAGSDGGALAAFTTGVLLRAAQPDRAGVLYSSTYSNRSYVCLRLLSALGHVSPSAAWVGRLSRSEWARLDRAAAEFSSARVWIVDHPLTSLDLIEEAIESRPPDTGHPKPMSRDRTVEVREIIRTARFLAWRLIASP